MDTGGFVQIWRVAWRDLRQQHDVLKMLYEQVAQNDGALPAPPPERALDAHLRWLDELETSIGARDAYATAIVMFVDDLLKRVYGAYKAVGGPEPLTVGLRGVPLHRLFKTAGNNVRHYQEWNEVWERASTADEKDQGRDKQRLNVKRAVKVFAQALDHPRPVQVQHLRGYAVNLASAVVLAIGGTYEAFAEQIQAALLEMVRGLGEMNDPWVRQELMQGTVAS